MLKEIASHVTNAALLGNRETSGAGRCSLLSGRASGAGPRQAIPSERKPGASIDSTPWLKVKNPEAPAVKREDRGRLGQVGNPARAVALFTWTATAPQPLTLNVAVQKLRAQRGAFSLLRRVSKKKARCRG